MSTTNLAKKEQLLQLMREKGIVCAGEIEKAGIHHEYIRRLSESGELIKLSRGMYSLPNRDITEHNSIMEICKRFPHAVICLLTALLFYDLTTQLPHEIWIAIGSEDRKPKIEYPPIRVFHFSKQAFYEGINEYNIDGCIIKVYCPAKTIADCFKHRNKIGIDVALEALNEGIRQKKATYNEILHYAKICRVEKIIKPYLETIVWERSEH